MPVAYNFPTDWLGKPADPAAHYATGMQIGMRMGAEQAANQFRQQQLFMEQQKQAFEQQYAQQKQALEVGEIIQKQRAAAAYQGMVSQGINPMQALEMVGPSMGMDPERMASLQMNRERWQAQLAATQEDRAQRMAFQRQRQSELEKDRLQRAEEKKREFEILERDRRERAKEAAKLGSERLELQKATIAQRNRQAAEKAILQDPNYLKLQADLATSTRLLNTRIAKGTGLLGLGSKAALDSEVSALAKQVADKQKAIKQFHDQFVDAHPPIAFTTPVQEEATNEGGEAFGDNNMPDTEGAPMILSDSGPASKPFPETSRRVRMRNPQGKTGTLPEDQVEAAIAKGWTKL